MILRRYLNHAAVVAAFFLVGCGGNEPVSDPTVTTSTTVTSDSADVVDESTPPSIDSGTSFFATPEDDQPIKRAEIDDESVEVAPTNPPAELDADGDGFYTRDEMLAAITARYPEYEWPKEYRVELLTFLDRGERLWGRNDRFEAPGEYTIIGIPYRCAWHLTLLDALANGDDASMVTSLERLREENNRNPMIAPDALTVYEETYDLAELGDIAQLQQMTETSCDPSRFSTPEPTGIAVSTRR